MTIWWARCVCDSSKQAVSLWISNTHGARGSESSKNRVERVNYWHFVGRNRDQKSDGLKIVERKELKWCTGAREGRGMWVKARYVGGKNSGPSVEERSRIWQLMPLSAMILLYMHMSHPGILLICKFWFSRPGAGPIILHIYQAPRRCHCSWWVKPCIN
jgi:hypothetical protein